MFVRGVAALSGEVGVYAYGVGERALAFVDVGLQGKTSWTEERFSLDALSDKLS